MSDRHDHDDSDDARGGTAGPPIKLVGFLILTILLAVFFFQNTHDAHVEFLWLDGDWPVWAVIGISALVGILLSTLFRLLWNRARDKPPRTR